MKKYDVIVIGAGAAGLFASLNIDKSKKVLLLEKTDKVGKKLLMAGAGRCNITHEGDINDFFSHYGENHRFLKNSFNNFDNKKLLSFLKKNEMEIIIDKNGKIFPITESSKDVVDLLLNLCMKNNFEIKKSEMAVDIKKENELFLVKTKNSEYLSKYLIITTGGKSYPSTGSSGDGYEFSKKMGHNLIDIKPALTPVYIKEYFFSEISGVSLNKRDIELYRNNKKIKTHNGDIGFTHKGLSGPGILDFSRYFEINDILKINIIDKKIEEFRIEFIERAEKDGKISIKRFLKENDIPESLINKILEKSNCKSDIKLGELNKKIRNMLITNLCEYSFEISEIGDYNVAMVTRGGVDLKEINSKTMESKLIKNLYFAGEIIDIDGDTGGYNIQAAFSTAYTAIKDINEK